MRLIDAEEMEKNGWKAERIVQVDPHTMEWQRQMPTDFPAIDAVPVKHAKLVNPNPFGECSICGYLIDIRQEYNYCPNCGAKMDGGKDDE